MDLAITMQEGIFAKTNEVFNLYGISIKYFKSKEKQAYFLSVASIETEGLGTTSIWYSSRIKSLPEKIDKMKCGNHTLFIQKVSCSKFNLNKLNSSRTKK